MLLDKTSQFANSCTPWMLDPPYTVCQDVQWCMWFEHWMVSTNLPARMQVLPLYDTRVPRFLDLSSSYHSTVSLRAGPPTKMWSVPELLPNLWISYECPVGVYMMLRLGKTSRDCCANGSRSTNASSVSAKFGSPRDCYMDRHHRSWRMGSMFEGNKSCCNCQKSRRSDAYSYSMLRLMLLLHFLTTTCSDDYRNSLLWWLWTTQAFPIMASVAVQHMASQLWIPSIP